MTNKQTKTKQKSLGMQEELKRSNIADILTRIGEKVKLCGWINAKRDHGKVIFLDLRDRSGLVQIVGGEEFNQYNNEDVVCIRGIVTERGERFVNPKLASGKIEIQAEKVDLLSRAKTLPLDIYGDGSEINEETRLRFRYLDLRRPRLKNNLYLRHLALQQFRQCFTEEGFWEIDTPNLSKSTPEGARDFLVPSRLQPGKFYALPQSPQQYKQLLMVAGIERYFQIATCFRDEDLRADRGFEFKQVDVEMSFVTRDEVLDIIEKIAIKVVEKMGKKILTKPFPRITYKEAMEKYHDDKFDMRHDKDPNVLAFSWVIDFPLFEKTETKAINPSHHPFTSPNPEDIDLLDSNPMSVRSWQYDLVCNGMEVAGGSIRITDPDVQTKIFKILGHSEKEIESKFGHLLEAFHYGVPPHGGIALGFERWVMLFAGENNMREVNAFPINTAGKTSVMEAPSEVSVNQLRELGIGVVSLKRR